MSGKTLEHNQQGQAMNQAKTNEVEDVAKATRDRSWVQLLETLEEYYESIVITEAKGWTVQLYWNKKCLCNIHGKTLAQAIVAALNWHEQQDDVDLVMSRLEGGDGETIAAFERIKARLTATNAELAS